MNTAQLIDAIRAHIKKGEHAKDKAEQHFVSAGEHLKTLKAQHDEGGGSWAEWESLVKDKCGIGKSRASKLMQIADGRTTVDQSRAANAEANKRLRERKVSPSRDGETDEPSTGRALAVVEPDDMPTEAEGAASCEACEQLKIENIELRRQLDVYKAPVRCEFVEDDGGRAAAGYGEAGGDCVARAIAIATGKPYAEVFEALDAGHVRYVKRLRPGSDAYISEERRRTEPVHNGCSEKVYGPYLRSLGWQYTRIRERVYLRAGALPSGGLIVHVDHHAIALIDGVIRDTYDSGGQGRRPVLGYWSRVEPAADEHEAPIITADEVEATAATLSAMTAPA